MKIRKKYFGNDYAALRCLSGDYRCTVQSMQYFTHSQLILLWAEKKEAGSVEK